jgi:hypothetical protein
MKKTLLLVAAIVLAAMPSTAVETPECWVWFQTHEEEEIDWIAPVWFMNGSELNKTWDTYNYNPFSTYIVVAVEGLGENSEVVLTIPSTSTFIASGTEFELDDLDRLVRSGALVNLQPEDPALPQAWMVIPLRVEAEDD